MKQCESRVLAKLGNFRVDHCSCGTFSLHTDSISMRLDSKAIIALSTVLNAASLRCEELTECQQELVSLREEEAETKPQSYQSLESKHDEEFH